MSLLKRKCQFTRQGCSFARVFLSRKRHVWPGNQTVGCARPVIDSLITYAYRSHGGWALFTRGYVDFHLCLSVCFSRRYLKNRCSYDRQTWRTNVTRWVLEIHLFWGQKDKGQGHNVCVGFQTERNIDASWLRT